MSVPPDWREEAAEAIGNRTAVDWNALPAADEGEVAGFKQLAEIAAAFAETAGESAAVEPTLFAWGPLQVRARIGEGTFGEVYRAWDPALARPVALKLRRQGPEGEAPGGHRFLEEGRRLARVRHPNVLLVHGAAVHAGRVGVWTELIDGTTLEARLAADGPLSPSEATQVALDLAGALAALHGAGLVHGDVKAANVMRERGGRLVLMDLGAAREVDGPAYAALEGTPTAMAPELFSGAPPTPASDLYALGVLLFRLLSGRNPIEVDSLHEHIRRHERGEMANLRDLRPDLPADLVALVERALAARPSDRFASAGEMARALAALTSAGDRSVAGESARAPRGPRRKAGRGARVALVLGLALVAGGLFAAAVWFRDRPTAPLVAVPGTRPRVAVLGLQSLVPARDGEAWLAVAISELLRGSLAAEDVVRVTSAEEVERMVRDLALDGRESYAAETAARIGRNLGVDWLTTGSLVEAPGGGALRLVVRLQRASDGTTIATVSRTGRPDDLFALADAVAGELHGALGLPPTGGGGVALVRSLPEDLAARRAYVEGVDHLRRLEAPQAVARLTEATRGAPDFPLAWHELSRALERGGREREAIDAAREALSRASRLDAAERRKVEANFLRLTGEAERAAALLAETVRAHPDEPEAVLDYVGALLAAGRPRDALVALAPFESREGDPALDLRLLLSASRAAEVVGEGERALAIAERAERLAVSRDAATLVAEALLRQAAALADMEGDRYGEQLERLDRGLTWARRVGDPILEMRLQWTRGVVQQAAGGRDPRHWDEAERSWTAALATARARGARSAERSLLTNLGQIAFRRGEVTAMVRRFDECLELCAELRSASCRATVAITASQAYELAGDLERARQMAEEGRAAAIGQSEADEAQSLASVAGFALRAGDPRQAERQFGEALALWRRLGQHRSALWAEADLALPLLAMGRGEEIAARLAEIASDPQTASDRFLEAYVRTSLARIDIVRGDLAAAERESARAVALAPTPLWPTVSYPAALARAATLAARGERAAARRLLVASRDLAVAKGARFAEIEASIDLAALDGGTAATVLLDRLASEARRLGDLALATQAEAARRRLTVR